MLTQLEMVPSTNDYLLQRLPDFPHGYGVYSLNQTEGKGRRGNLWLETKGKSLALSLVFHELGTENLGVLSLVIGIAVKRALERLEVDVALKWSNDMIYSEKKLGGILCESKISQNVACVVVGIGINLTQTAEDFNKQGLPHGISLAGTKAVEVPPDYLAETLAEECRKIVLEWQKDGFVQNLKQEYEACCLTLGREIRLRNHWGEQVGRGVGITEQGNLLWEREGILGVVSSGEVSIRGKTGYL